MDRTRHSGFTLTELVIAILVFSVLAVVSVPNYVELRERQALRGAAESFQVAIAQAKAESVKRGEMVRVEFHEVGNALCVGAIVVDTAGAAGCDCSTTACAVAAYPEEPGTSGALKRVALDGDIVFGGADADGFVIDPRTGTLVDVTSTGGFVLATDAGYQVQLDVNVMGRASICTPSGAESLAGVKACD